MSAAPRIPARPTTYAGVQMRSRLEAGFAQWLDKHNVNWEYEPQAFAGETGQYLPDFRLNDFYVLGNTTTTYIEVKPDLTVDVWYELTARMPIIWQSEPDAVLVLVSAAMSFRQYGVGLPQILRPGAKETYSRFDFDIEDWTYVHRRGEPHGTVGIGRRVSSPWPRGYWEGRG